MKSALGETTMFSEGPISVLTRLIERKSLGAFQQPCAEADVNEVIDAWALILSRHPWSRLNTQIAT